MAVDVRANLGGRYGPPKMLVERLSCAKSGDHVWMLQRLREHDIEEKDGLDCGQVSRRYHVLSFAMWAEVELHK